MLVANSELAIKRGDYDAAIAMLSNVPPSSPAFAKAQMAKADIYLQYRKDKHLYARCYQVSTHYQAKHDLVYYDTHTLVTTRNS